MTEPAIRDGSNAAASTDRSAGVAAGGFLPGIEALRGVAAMAVVFHHSWELSTMPRFTGYWVVEGFGAWGVDIFFLLSGFLLAEYFWQPKSQRSLRAFYTRRIFRIVPAYYVNVIVLYLFFAQHSSLFSHDGARQVVTSATFTFWWFPQTASSLNVNGVLWTLSIEMTLYLLMPLMALAVARRPAVAIGTFLGIGLGWHYVVARHVDLVKGLFNFGAGNSEGLIRLYLARQFPGIIGLFAVGIGLRWLVHRGHLARFVKPTERLSVVILGVLLLPSVLWLAFVERSSDYQHWLWFTGFDLALVVLATPALLYAARPVVGRMQSTMRVATWFGERSYGIYLWHFPVVLSFYGRGPLISGPDVSHIWVKLPLIVLVSVALGNASYHMIELPARQYGRRLAKRFAPSPLLEPAASSSAPTLPLPARRPNPLDADQRDAQADQPNDRAGHSDHQPDSTEASPLGSSTSDDP